MVERQCKLGESGDARRGLQMPEIGFDRPDPQRLVARSAASENAPECGRLDRIAHRRAGPVRFHVVHLRRADSGAAVDLVQQMHLLIQARDCHAAGPAVLVHARRPDDRVDAIAVCKCLVERTQDD